MQSHTTEWTLWALWNANARPDREPNFRLQEKQKQACFLKLCKECPFLSVFSRPVCGAAFLLIRPCQEVEQMLPWHPSGPRTPALAPTPGAPRRTTHITGPSQRGVATTKKKRKEKLSSSGSSSSDAAQTSVWMLLSFMLRVCVYVWEREVPVSYQTGPLGSFEVFPLCFNTLLPSWRSHTRTPIWKTNTNDGNASIWCKLVRKCSLEIIISRYVSRWFQRVTQRAALWHSDWCHSTYFILFKLSSKLVVLVILKVWEPSRPLGVKPNVPILALFDGLIDTDEQLWINSCII